MRNKNKKIILPKFGTDEFIKMCEAIFGGGKK